MSTDDPLAALRPIHWPEPVSFWPPAIGWWLLPLLLLLAAILIWRYRYARRDLRQARAMLDHLAQQPLDDPAFVAALNQLLKRIALTQFPNDDITTLSGQPWVAFLDASGGGGDFCNGAGRVLASAPYQAHPSGLDREALLTLSYRWVAQACSHKEHR